MAIAAGVAAAAATAISTGVSVASQAGAFGGNDPGKPEFQQVPKRPFETAQQKYLSRVMLANMNNRGPSYQDWLKSGGTAKFELTNTGMTPEEARQLGFVGPGGRPADYVDPTTVADTGLTKDEFAYMGMQAPKGTGPAARVGRITRRMEKLEGLGTTQEGGLRPGQQKRLERLGARKEKILAKNYRGSESEV